MVCDGKWDLDSHRVAHARPANIRGLVLRTKANGGCSSTARVRTSKTNHAERRYRGYRGYRNTLMTDNEKHMASDREIEKCQP